MILLMEVTEHPHCKLRPLRLPQLALQIADEINNENHTIEKRIIELFDFRLSDIWIAASLIFPGTEEVP